MRQILIKGQGTTDVLEIEDAPDIKVEADDDVIIDVKAIGINFADILMRVGFYPEMPPLPFVPGYECSGIVKEVGRKVKKVKKGDKVIGLTKFGSYATLSRAKEDKTFLLPNNMDYIKGAAIPISYFTAWAALNEFARIREGEHVLIHTCAGAVGLSATQIALDKKCIIYGTSGSDEKCDYLRKIGVKYPINYRKQDFVEEFKKISPQGLDVILDGIGFDNLLKDREILKMGGKIVFYGNSAIKSGKKKNPLHAYFMKRKTPKINPVSLLFKNHGIIGLNLLPMWDIMTELIERVGNQVMQKMKDGTFNPVIAKTFPFEKVADAHTYIEERKNIGKVVLTL